MGGFYLGRPIPLLVNVLNLSRNLLRMAILLWQPLDTKSNDHTSNKSLRQISSGKFTRELDKESLLN